MLTAYCMSFGTMTVIPQHWREQFSELRDLGFDAVALSFSEGEMRYGRRAFEMQVESAHECGLKAFVIPSRIGGRFAGAPLMHCMWLTMNPESQMPGNPHLACIDSEPFVEWIRDFMRTVISDYPVDGIIWDEIKNSGMISDHPATLKKYGRIPTTEEAMDNFVDFLGNLTGLCMEIRPELVVTMFNSATAPEYFTSRAARIPHFQYCGYDGNFALWNYFHEPPAQHKYLLGDAWERTVRECAGGGKKTFALVENFCIPQTEHANYQRNLDDYLSKIHPDHLAVYLYGINNECPEEIHAMTMDALRKHRFAR